MNTVKTWTWPELESRMTGFWPIGDELPPDILSGGVLLRHMRNSFIAGREALFSPLKTTQPLTFKSLMRFRDIQLVQNKKYPTLFDVAAFTGDHFIFIEPFSRSDDNSEYWSELFSHMPDFLQSYYSNFNGMRGSRKSPGAPGNLPAGSTRWHRLADYAKENSVNKNKLQRLRENFVSLDELFIFVKTDWKDLVFLDFNSTSKNVYVVPEERFEDYFRLDNAPGIIDKLCAHVIDGASGPFYIRNDS